MRKGFPDAHEAIVETAMARDFSQDPTGFEERLYKVDKDAHAAMMSNAVRRVLLRFAAEHKQAGDSEASEMLEKIAGTFNGSSPRSRREEPKPYKKPETQEQLVANSQWEFFEDQVASTVEPRLTAKINEEIAGRNVQFKNDAQRDKFVESVFDSIDKALSNDMVFVRERDRVQDPRLGLTKDQRKQAVDLYLKYATLNGRLAKIVAEEIDSRNLPIKAKEVLERKEITGSGTAPAGTLTKDDKDKIWDAGRKKGLSGSDLTQFYWAEVRKMRSGK